jgi:predicted GNAT family acetyltransferase
MSKPSIDTSLLDNPVWSSLISHHRHLAVGEGLARRYPSEVSRISAIAEPSEEAFADLRGLVGPEEVVGVVTAFEVTIPDDWEIVNKTIIDQMIFRSTFTMPDSAPERLTEADVPEMMAIVEATEPGPFAPGTIRMGEYYGIRSESGGLAAMTGQRMQTDSFTEISAVCTYPEYRGRGYAKHLMSYVGARIQAEGKTPFLHVKTDNGARLLYEKLGFELRCPMNLNVITPK